MRDIIERRSEGDVSGVRRPKVVYFIGVWCLFWIFVHLRSWIRIFCSLFGISESVFRYCPDPALLLLPFVIFLLIGMIQLRPIPRWITVAFLSLLAVRLPVVLTVNFVCMGSLPFATVVIAFGVFAVNVVLVGYLLSPRFREISSAYRAQKRSPRLPPRRLHIPR